MTEGGMAYAQERVIPSASEESSRRAAFLVKHKRSSTTVKLLRSD